MLACGQTEIGRCGGLAALSRRFSVEAARIRFEGHRRTICRFQTGVVHRRPQPGRSRGCFASKSTRAPALLLNELRSSLAAKIVESKVSVNQMAWVAAGKLGAHPEPHQPDLPRSATTQH